MCGIGGIVKRRPGGRVEPAALEAMARVQLHRGPDDQGLWIAADGRAGLSHRRLSIVDLSEAGHQPMANSDGSVQVVFNGEIYNFRELGAWLEGRGHRFRSNCDTEVLVYLYEELGDAMVERLDGDFSFGIWDARAERLLLARDPFGVKPLYYAVTDDAIVFSSEIKALFESGELGTPELDEESLYHYLTFLMVPPPGTLFRKVRKLAAASTLVFERRASAPEPRVSKYWEPIPRTLDLSGTDLDQQLEHLFRRAVEKRLMSDVPVGVLFSGGVDSTLNAGFFQDLVEPERVRTYTVGMKDAPSFEDECASARRRAGLLGTEHHEIRIGEEDLLRVVMSLARYQDEPLADPVCVPLYFIAKLARETGTIVLQAGEGADEIFCGYDDYRRWMVRHARFWRPLQRMPRAVGKLAFAALRRSHHPLRLKMADACLRSLRGQEFFMSSAVGYYENEKRAILSRDFRERYAGLDSFDLVAPLYNRIEEVCPDASVLERMTFIELQHRLPELLLMRVDKMTMAASVEPRVPFLDRDLVAFALSAPQSFKLRDGVLKEPLKRLAARSIGAPEVYGPKRGFVAPIQSWFRTRLGEELRAILEEDRTELEPYFDLSELARRLDGPLATVNQAFQLWVTFNLAVWRRSFFA